MKTILELKNIFKDRKIVESNVINTYDDVADLITVKMLKGLHIDEAQVALISNVLSMASSFKNKEFAIDLLQGALAELESEHFRESGNRLS